jgi:hypothetical protein
MKLLLTKHPHKTERTRIRRAWLPRKISDGSREWVIWLRRYVADEIYYARGVSFTGFDYTPRGWHVLRARPVFIVENAKLSHEEGEIKP